MTDPRSREPRTFQCRPALWVKFEELARRADCSVDFLINDAMRVYARRLSAAQAPPPPVARRGPRSVLPTLRPGAPRPTLPPPPRRSTGPRALQIECDGQLFAVTRPRFVIGRGKRSSDFVIKDPNVSRQHALIEQRGLDYFLIDLGSTNGILVGGARVQEHRIAHGDVVEICGHALRLCLG